MHVGHTNGTVTLWSPNMKEPLVKISSHTGIVNDIAIDRTGMIMVTTGVDKNLKVWDIRMFKILQTYFNKRIVDSIDISHTGLLAIGFDRYVEVWKDFVHTEKEEPYMKHVLPKYTPNNIPIYGSDKKSFVESLNFCPFEDVLGIGHHYGFSSIIIPGAGEPNFDSNEANPYETKMQRREATVTRLLDKLPPDMITLNPDEIGTFVYNPDEIEKHKEAKFKEKFPGKDWSPKYKARGRSTATTVHRKKQHSVMDRKRAEFEEERIGLEKEEKIRKKRKKNYLPLPSMLCRGSKRIPRKIKEKRK